MNSLEKLAKFQAELQSAEPTDEASARLSQLATLAGPMIGGMLPDDPALVDDYLLKLSAWCLQQRSDDAGPAAVALQAPSGEWHVQTAIGDKDDA